MASTNPSRIQWPALSFGPLNLWSVAPAWQLSKRHARSEAPGVVPPSDGYRVGRRSVGAEHYIQARNR